jgi:hypothetical protein
MKLHIESTTKIVTLDGVPARIWEGTTEAGIAVHCYVTRIAVRQEDDAADFERELAEHRAPTADVVAIPLRLLL